MKKGVEGSLFFVAVLVMGVALVFWARRVPMRVLAPVKQASMPEKAGAWTRTALDAGQKPRQGPAGTLSGEWCYRRAGDRVWVLLIEPTGKERHGVHDPEYCYAGNGWRVTGRRFVPGRYPMTEVKLRAEASGVTLSERYAFVTPGRTVASVVQRLWKEVSERLLRRTPTWSLLRVSVADDGTAHAAECLDSLCPVLSEALCGTGVQTQPR